jgi:DNA-binding NarL/FixJ family response regulator
VDFQLVGESGLWLARRLARLPRPPRTLVYSAFAGPALAMAALVSGARGIVPKSSLADELCTAIRALARGRLVLPALSRVDLDILAAGLRVEDRAALRMLARGVSLQGTAAALGLDRELLDEVRTRIARDLTDTLAVGPARGYQSRLDRAARGRRWRRPGPGLAA